MAKPKRTDALELRLIELEGLVAQQAQRIARLERKWRKREHGAHPAADRRPGPGARNHEGKRGYGQCKR